MNHSPLTHAFFNPLVQKRRIPSLRALHVAVPEPPAQQEAAQREDQRHQLRQQHQRGVHLRPISDAGDATPSV